jgi:hypothetical protein
MAINNIFFVFLSFLVSCNFDESYNVYIDYDSLERYSYIKLIKNNKSIDSIKIDDYYGKSKINKINNYTWHITYNERSGTDCSYSKQMIIKVYDNKIYRTLHLIYIIEDPEINEKYEINFIDEKMLKINYSSKKTEELNKTKSSFELKYDDRLKIYYNDSLDIDNKNKKGFNINNEFYFSESNDWYIFSKNKIYKLSDN